MSDLISRQAVIDTIETDCSWDIFNEWGSRTPTGECIINAIKSVPSVEPERKTGKWIPIRFKSPQQGQRVFISTIKGTIHDEIWNMNRIYNYATDGCWYRNWFVIAWMPLPEPYKAESEDKA